MLKARYDASLVDDRIVALSVGTRPDCVTEEVAELLRSYAGNVDVWVELGLQTSNDATAKRINRGYETAVFARAVSILRDKGIPVVVHIIAGLPGEGKDDLLRTVDFVNGFGLWGIKLHSIYVMRGTALEGMYRDGSFVPPTLGEYADIAASAIAHLSPEMTVHRITGDCPPGLLVAPEWNRDKNAVIAAINRILEENDWRQGCLFGAR